MWRWSLAVIAILAGAATADRERAPSGLRAKHHMRQHLSDMRAIERLLVEGRLEEAKAITVMFGAEMGPDIARGAVALRNATTIEDAIHAQVRIATACARCHLDAQALPAFRMPSGAPRDRPTTGHQMARYQWGADRAWEGLVGSSAEHWRAGMYVVATSSLPRFAPAQPDLARRLQARARRALDDTTLEARADAYAELLVICADCHRQIATPPSPSGAASSKSTISASDTGQ